MLRLDPADELQAKIVSSWPGWRLLRDGSYSAYPHPSCAKFAFERLPDADDDLSEIAQKASMARAALQSPATCTDLPFRKLMPHQKQAVAAAKFMDWRVLLADDMGLGKTTEALAMVYNSQLGGGVDDPVGSLIICPKGLRSNWEDEIKSCFGDQVLVAIVDGGPKKKIEKILDAKEQLESGRTTFLVLHYDMLPRAAAGLINALSKFLEVADAVICDESHALKSKKAQRTQAVMKMVDRSSPKTRILATGTPVRNQVDDLYTQIEIIRPQTWISYSDFERRYLDVIAMEVALPGGKKKIVSKTVGSKNVGELNQIVNTVQIRRKKTEVLDLPQIVRSFPVIDLDDESHFWYTHLEKRAVIALSEVDPNLTIFDPKVKSVMEQATRCAQICQGFIGGWEQDHADLATMIDALKYIPGREKDLMIPNSAKAKWMISKIEEVVSQGGQPVIFGNFNSPLIWLHDYVSNELNMDAEFIHGEVKTERRHDIVKRFQQGSVRVLFSQVSIAEGWNATAGNHAFFYGRDWSPAVNEQAEARLHRIGQKSRVFVYTPIMKNTIEQNIDRSLRRKGDVAERAIMTVKDIIDGLS